MFHLGMTSDFFDVEGNLKFPDFNIERLKGDERISFSVVEAGDEMPPNSLAGFQLNARQRCLAGAALR